MTPTVAPRAPAWAVGRRTRAEWEPRWTSPSFPLPRTASIIAPSARWFVEPQRGRGREPSPTINRVDDDLRLDARRPVGRIGADCHTVRAVVPRFDRAHGNHR